MTVNRPAVSPASVDWPGVRVRLAQASEKTREALHPSAACVEKILDERARRLSQPLAVARKEGVVLDVLTFSLSGEGYGIETRHVHEVVRCAGLTPVPGVPDVVAGLANLRGQILGVFDIRPLLKLAPKPAADGAWILVCGDSDPDLGIVVDAVSDVVRLRADELLAVNRPQDRAEAVLARGLTRDAMTVLDGTALLADRRLFIEQTQRQ